MNADGKVARTEVESGTETSFRTLIRVNGLLDRVMQPYFGRFGLSRSQWGALRTLHRAELAGSSGLRLMDLGDRLLVRPASVTGLTDRLQRLGYVVRCSSECDLRGKEVRLTHAGRSLVERILEGHGTQIGAVMSGLDTDEQIQLGILLQQLATHLESMVEEREHAQA